MKTNDIVITNVFLADNGDIIAEHNAELANIKQSEYNVYKNVVLRKVNAYKGDTTLIFHKSWEVDGLRGENYYYDEQHTQFLATKYIHVTSEFTTLNSLMLIRDVKDEKEIIKAISEEAHAIMRRENKRNGADTL